MKRRVNCVNERVHNGVSFLVAHNWFEELAGVRIAIADMEETGMLFPTKTEIIL